MIFHHFVFIHCLEQTFGRVATLRGKVSKESWRLVDGGDDNDEHGPYGLYEPIDGRDPSDQEVAGRARFWLQDDRYMHSGMVDSQVNNLLVLASYIANYCCTQGKPDSGPCGAPYLQSYQQYMLSRWTVEEVSEEVLGSKPAPLG
jgi:hypothetical protein